MTVHVRPIARAARLTGVLAALAIGLVACSSDSESDTSKAVEVESADAAEPTAAADGTGENTDVTQSTAAPEAEPTSDVDCEPLYLNRGPYSTVAGGFTRSTTQAEAEEQQTRFSPADMREIVEIYRPYQDVEGEVFGTLREGLDNLSNDIDAFEAGTFAGPTGESYKTASIAPVLQAIGC